MQKDKNIKKGFTLSETIIVLAVLGIIALFTIPSFYSSYKERVNKTKVAKAMVTFENFVPKFLKDNNVKNEVEALNQVWMNSCTPIFKQFKIKEIVDETNSCVFIGDEDLVWDFNMFTVGNSTFLAAKISFPNNENIVINKQIATNFNNEPVNSFLFYFTKQNGKLYINDPNHTPWKKFAGLEFCNANPFGENCNTTQANYDSISNLLYRYLKK